MTIHKEFIDQIIKQYSATLGDLISDRGLDITKSMKSVDELPDQLDKIFYTLEFLKKEGLIEIKETRSNTTPTIFQIPIGSDIEKIPAVIFYHEKLKQSYDWDIEIKPGLIHFKQQGYQTDGQIKEDKQFWLAIGIAVLASFLSALFTTYFPKIF
ncbi:MAG: hypothetical protein COS76_03425 [Candidatus Portnoybacteria bacterium CG06_land_8_20_14_3_00_39_12]|uniref:Uncharacterized protein n=1 Tax=Candidatus Portnoybacteria bacterium CG06_land_8_20_14_3_00_39_12 TaxID=1974809 RepID=A0A2M7AWJ3_9BACT|nr:MAG: hypothetical protein COS76_03425 [Candidatus Portnoybacteria bacterium CG06_land_8_20_14_3_00_39_12]